MSKSDVDCTTLSPIPDRTDVPLSEYDINPATDGAHTGSFLLRAYGYRPDFVDVSYTCVSDTATVTAALRVRYGSEDGN